MRSHIRKLAFENGQLRIKNQIMNDMLDEMIDHRNQWRDEYLKLIQELKPDGSLMVIYPDIDPVLEWEVDEIKVRGTLS